MPSGKKLPSLMCFVFRQTRSRLLQPKKASSSIYSTFSGMTISFRLLQPWKA